MSLNFATKNWKFELTLEALHIQPLHHNSDDEGNDAGSRRSIQRSNQQTPRVADYFLSRLISPAASLLRKQS